MPRFAALLGLATVLAMTSACASSTSPSRSGSATTHPHEASTSAGTGQPITIHATDAFRFMPTTLDVHVGTVKITLIADGSYPHNLSVPALHVTSKTVDGTPGNQSTTLTLHLANPGTYSFECTYHASAGMRGKIVVHA